MVSFPLPLNFFPLYFSRRTYPWRPKASCLRPLPQTASTPSQQGYKPGEVSCCLC